MYDHLLDLYREELPRASPTLENSAHVWDVSRTPMVSDTAPNHRVPLGLEKVGIFQSENIFAETLSQKPVPLGWDYVATMTFR